MTINGKHRAIIVAVPFVVSALAWLSTMLWDQVMTRFDRTDQRLRTIQESLSNLSTYNAVLQEQYTTLGLVAQDHETRIRRIERRGM